MSMPIMFIFKLEQVVTRSNVRFCDRKMAHAGIVPGDDEGYFDSIDFTKVYHDSAIADPVLRNEINDRRMAEVLVPDELPLNATLDMIICRTQFDAISLQHLMRAQDQNWRTKLRVSTKPAEMFFCWGAYVIELQLAGSALTLRVKASRDYTQGQQLKFNICQQRANQATMVLRANYALANNPMLISGWDPAYTDNWLIEIEDALAFCGPVPVAQSTVVSN